MWVFKWWKERYQTGLRCGEQCLLHKLGTKYDVASPAVHSALSVCVVGMQIHADGCIWSGLKGTSQRGEKKGGCGRSKTNGPIKSFKGAAIYLLCVTGWRFTSLIRPGTYQHCFFFSVLLSNKPLSFSANCVWSKKKNKWRLVRQKNSTRAKQLHHQIQIYETKKVSFQNKKMFHIWKNVMFALKDWWLIKLNCDAFLEQPATYKQKMTDINK